MSTGLPSDAPGARLLPFGPGPEKIALFVGLVRVAKADALPVPGLDALLEASVAEVAEVSEHVREGRYLRPPFG